MVLTQAGIKFKKMNKRFSMLIALLLLTCCGTNAPKSNVAATANHNPPPQKVYAKQMKLFKQKKVFPKMGYICVEKKHIMGILGKDTIERCIIPHLTVEKRGFASKVPLVQIVNSAGDIIPYKNGV